MSRQDLKMTSKVLNLLCPCLHLTVGRNQEQDLGFLPGNLSWLA